MSHMILNTKELGLNIRDAGPSMVTGHGREGSSWGLEHDEDHHKIREQTYFSSHRIHGAAIYGNMDPINIPPMLAYIPYMDPMGLDSPPEFMDIHGVRR